MDINEIRQLLPHRYPFLLVDRVVAIDLEQKTINAYKNVSINEPFFNGHFPQHPIMPGVLIIEAMAQAAGILGVKSGKKEMGLPDEPEEDGIYFFVGIDKARFRKTVGPGDQLILNVALKGSRRGIWTFDAKATVDEKVVCNAEIMCTAAGKGGA